MQYERPFTGIAIMVYGQLNHSLQIERVIWGRFFSLVSIFGGRFFIRLVGCLTTVSI